MTTLQQKKAGSENGHDALLITLPYITRRKNRSATPHWQRSSKCALRARLRSGLTSPITAVKDSEKAHGPGLLEPAKERPGASKLGEMKSLEIIMVDLGRTWSPRPLKARAGVRAFLKLQTSVRACSPTAGGTHSLRRATHVDFMLAEFLFGFPGLERLSCTLACLVKLWLRGSHVVS